MKKITGLGLVLLCGLVLTGCGSTDTSKLESKINKLEKNIASLTEKIDELEAADAVEETEEDSSDDILEGMVKVPDPYFKTKDQVEAEFKEVGLKVKFVVKNFDSAATTNKKKISKGDCYQLESNSGAEYLSTSDGLDLNDTGYYAEEGATITVGYTDHDFDGSKDTESSSSSSSKESSESSSSETKTSEKAAKTESSGSRLNIADKDIEAIKTYKDYLDIYQKIIKNYLSEYEEVFKGTVLYDESAFTSMKEEYDAALEEQKKQYEDLGTSALVGKDTLVSYLKSYRDGLADYIDTMKAALN
ncbi:hypothetical protein I6N96_15720 [Enterococcus sp. BWM-S5]|uniref:DUF5105 domain-containing protein n=1 Tax=Enterococcus larvae TaxID=2794352 RepID=A0ABS4CP10_9ENTE|nr:hypothetical protein [Enterococcus larvae]MBP1047737.1 hypothetical protein [Enterococcus larvae]